MAPTTPKKSPDAPHKNLRMTPQRQRRSSLGALPNGAGAQRGRPKTSVDNRDKENSAHADTGLAGRSVQDAHNASASIAGSSAGSETVIPDGWLASRGTTASAPATASFSISFSSASFHSVDGADPPSVVLPGGAGDDGGLSTDSKLEISQITYSSYDADASEVAGVDAFAQTGASLKGGVTVKKETSDDCDEEQDILVAITAKPELEHISLEELRWEHYVAKSTSASICGITDEVDDVDNAQTDTSETLLLQGIDCQRGTVLESSDGSGDTNHSSVGSSEDGSIDTNSTTTVELLSRQLARSEAEKRTLSIENAQLKDQCNDLTGSLRDSNARILDLEQQLADQQNDAIAGAAVNYCALYHKVDDELHQETLKSEELSKDVETLSDKVMKLQWDCEELSTWLGIARGELAVQQTGFDEKEGTLKEKVSSSAKENELLMDEVAALTKDKDTLQKQLNDTKASASVTKLELEFANSSLDKEKVAIEEQLEATVLEKDALSKQVSTQAEEKTQLEEQCSTLKKSEATLQKENITLTVEKDALSKQMSALTEEQSQLEEQCNSLKESEATLKKANATLTVETGELNVRANALAGMNATLQVQVGAITEQRDDLRVQCEEQKTTLAQLLDQDDSFLYQYDDEESEWEFVAYERDQLAQKLDEAKAKISELNEELSSRGAIVALRMQKEKDALTDEIKQLTREVEKKHILARKVDSLKNENQQLRQEVEVRKAQWQQQCSLGDD